VTARLDLRPVAADDVAGVHAVFGDPATWTHLPSGRHTHPDETAQMIDRAAAGWRVHGLDSWTVRLAEPVAGVPAGTVVGLGGVSPREPDHWNLGYRLSPAVWGHGLAAELAAAAVEAAHEHTPGRPVVARVLTTNPASLAVARRAGLVEVLRGARPDGLVRVVLADRALEPDLLDGVAALG
jgi:RimJ/RimL family protein N-acetyltransferase